MRVLAISSQQVSSRTSNVDRVMSSISEFVAAALKSDPSLSGSTDKDRAAIIQLESETESMSRDLPVCPIPAGEAVSHH